MASDLTVASTAPTATMGDLGASPAASVDDVRDCGIAMSSWWRYLSLLVEGRPLLTASSPALGPGGRAGGLLGTSSFLGGELLRGLLPACDGISLLEGGASTAPGVLTGARSLWRG